MASKNELRELEFKKAKTELRTKRIVLLSTVIASLSAVILFLNNYYGKVNSTNQELVADVASNIRGFNGNIGARDCYPAVGIAKAGQPMQQGCGYFKTQEKGILGEYYDVLLYYRNTTEVEAENVLLGMQANASSGNFNAFLRSSAGEISGSVKLSLPPNTLLVFTGAKVWQRQGDVNLFVIREIRTIEELASFTIPNIPSYNTCLNNDAFCYQGFFVASFTVVSDSIPKDE